MYDSPLGAEPAAVGFNFSVAGGLGDSAHPPQYALVVHLHAGHPTLDLCIIIH